MNTPVIDPVQALGSALVTFLTAKYIEEAGNPAAELAKAQSLLSVAQALEEVNSGNLAGVAALQTALQNLINTVKDPAGALALNEVFAVLATQMQALTGTLLGKLNGLAANLIIQQVASTAQYYVNALSQPSSAGK